MNKQCILIVEDEAAIADTLRYALETDSFQTVWVTSGKETLQAIEAQSFALIILDVGLPDTNGFDLFRKIRKQHDIPTIFLTARSDEVDRIVGLEIGADDYVTKPFSPRELVARVKAILRRNVMTSTTDNLDNCVEGDQHPSRFTQDKLKAAITFCNRNLSLTKSEYLILSFLLNQPERVYSRSQLMDAIWPTPHPSQERTIDSHIKTLRSKLREIEPTNNSIQTHRGLGYSLSLKG